MPKKPKKTEQKKEHKIKAWTAKTPDKGSDNLKKEGVPKEISLATENKLNHSINSPNSTVTNSGDLSSIFPSPQPIIRNQRIIQFTFKLTSTANQLLRKIAYEKRWQKVEVIEHGLVALSEKLGISINNIDNKPNPT